MGKYFNDIKYTKSDGTFSKEVKNLVFMNFKQKSLHKYKFIKKNSEYIIRYFYTYSYRF